VDYLFSGTDQMKIGLGGIKFSEKLVHVSHRALQPSDRSFVDILQRITEKRINLPFVCAGAVGNEIHSTFCIAATDFALFASIVDIPLGCEDTRSQPSSGLHLGEQLQVIHGVGTLTLFPHRRSLAILGLVVEILGQSGITIHSLCTSISAVAINVDYRLLDLAVEALEKSFELPDNHAPFRPEFSVRQISP
jgi:hypothetical protein